jgi:hypothetical protein
MKVPDRWTGITMGGFSLTNRSGPDFPSDPVDGDIWFQAERKIEYYWDEAAGQWLSLQLFVLDFSARADAFPITETNANVVQAASPFAGQDDIWAMEATFAGYLNTAGDWTAEIAFVDGSTRSVLASWTRVFGGTAQWTSSGPVAIGAVIASTAEIFQFGATRNSGTAQFYGSAALKYRLIG